MRMRNCAHTYLEASLDIVTKTENLIKKQEKKKHGRLLVSQVLAVVPNKEEEQGFRLFGMTIIVNLVVSLPSHTRRNANSCFGSLVV
jgi:hypothetical protein